eukprot:scaffold66253_cov16-Tisochrysis_lutea.AAC.1
MSLNLGGGTLKCVVAAHIQNCKVVLVGFALSCLRLHDQCEIGYARSVRHMQKRNRRGQPRHR